MIQLTKVGKAFGRCSNCGRMLYRDRPADVAYCICYRYCPQCDQVMTPFTPDLGKAYSSDKGLDVFFVCLNCKPPYYSKQTPVEVSLE